MSKFTLMKKGGKLNANKLLLSLVVIATVFGAMFLITSALGVKYSYQSLDGSGYTSCQSCGLLSSNQFTYSSNWGTWYVNQNALFPIQLKVNDMINPESYGNDYSEFHVILKDKSTGLSIADVFGSFPTTEYVESKDVYYNYLVTKEHSVEAVVYLKQYNGVWVESFYYQTNTRPTWTFKFQPTTVSDIDKDGVPDDSDMCKTQPETFNNYLDNDGCPDTVPSGTTTTTTGGGTTTTTIIPTNTTTPSSSSTSPTGNTVTEPDATDDGNDVVDNSWFEEGLANQYPIIIEPSPEKFSVANYKLISPQYLVFTGCGPDQDCRASTFYYDPNFGDPSNPWWKGVAEELPEYKTIGYEWDINTDGVADYTTKSFSHTFTLEDSGQTEKEIIVRLRVKMENVADPSQTGYSQPVEVKFLLIDKDTYSFPNLPCSEYAQDYSVGGGAVEALVYLGCALLKIGFFIMYLPSMIIANIFYAFWGILCIGEYGFIAGSIPILLVALLLLVCLIPDDIVSAVISAIMVFFLGTTAPAGAVSAVPILAYLVGTAGVPAFITGGSMMSSVKMGGGGIILGIAFLCLWNIFINFDTAEYVKFDSLKSKGTGEISIGKKGTVTRNGVKGLKILFSELTLIVIVLTYLECHWNVPLYSYAINFLMSLPQILQQLAEVLF